MPFPWKKNRVTRISQIVADLQSPKRGGSLVVETGFPTSLIDLFVKNRSRFKKTKPKKPVRPEFPDPPPPPPSPATTPPLSEPPSLAACAEPSRPDAPIPCRLVRENADAVPGSGRVKECVIRSGPNRVVGVFLKMLVVVGLIASVKKLTVGITLSAFALLFLEYAGKRVVSCSVVESLTRRVSSCVCFQKVLELKVKKDCVREPAIVQGEILSSDSIDEIEVVEIKSEVGICCEETCFVAVPEFGSLSGELLEDDSKGKLVVEPCEISECKTKSSRSGRFKSKMVKKLVPKKFRVSKKEKKEKRGKESEGESGSEVSSAVEEDKSPSFEIEEEQENRDRSELLIKSKLECIRDDEVDCGITYTQESLLVREEIDLRNEVKRIDRVGNSGYAILLVIALAGLVAGRLPALIFTMTWCFILKIVKSLWRSQSVPLIRCSVSGGGLW